MTKPLLTFPFATAALASMRLAVRRLPLNFAGQSLVPSIYSVLSLHTYCYRTNVAADVIDFSVEFVSMGGSDCPGVGDGAGQVLWAIDGIVSNSQNVTLKVASPSLTRSNS